VASEAHAVVHLGPLKLPRVAAREPVVGRFHLLAVDDALAEHAVFIADAVAHARHAERGHRVEKAGREPAEAAVAQRRVGLALGQRRHVDAEVGERIAHRVVQVDRQQRIGEGAPDQELHREVVNALQVLRIVGARGRHPALDQLVAHRHRGGNQPVVLASRHGVFADGVDELVGNCALEGGHVAVGMVIGEVFDGHGLRSMVVGCAPWRNQVAAGSSA
jgi:hypothetical protein